MHPNFLILPKHNNKYNKNNLKHSNKLLCMQQVDYL